MGMQYRLGVLGAGNMGMAIARGAVRGGILSAEEIVLFNRSEEKRAAHRAEGFAVSGDYCELFCSCERVILGVKPQNFAEILPVLAQTGCKPLVISIAAGVTFAKMQAELGADCPIVRAMPNTPLMLGEGATVLVGSSAAPAQQMEWTRALFASMGSVAVFDREDALNDVIPYNGSAPAYLYLFADGMVKSAAQHGIPEREALRLFCQTMIGSAKMLLESGRTPEELTREVCSPGGTTIEAVQVLRRRGLEDILAEASDRCIARAYELGD